MSNLTQLKAATSLHDVAYLLGYKPAALSYILYQIKPGDKYTEFEIPKRSGGMRKIKSPIPQLKQLQKKLACFLQECLDEINVEGKLKDEIAHGFKKKRSILTNAKIHRNKRWVFNVDLEDFFGTINFGRVRGFFLSDKRFCLQEKAATILAQIVCSDNKLPQGSPCSPIISNLIGHVLDIHLVRLAKTAGCRYTRYADDLTFSTNLQDFPTTIAKRISGDEHSWEIGEQLAHLVKHSGFSINSKKTRMQYHDSRQEVTGMVVNRKVNVRTEYRRQVRAMVHSLFTKGNFEHVHYEKDGAGGEKRVSRPGDPRELHGMLGFIDSVDRYNLHNIVGHTGNELKKKEQVYRDFLIYKEIYAPPLPVIICEGPTDNVYLSCAMRRLAAVFPRFAEINPKGEFVFKLRLLKYVKTGTGRVLGLSDGGTADLSKFMHTYRNTVKKFGPAGTNNPVIILIDNDSGAEGKGKPLQAVKQITEAKVDRTAPFTHVVNNLYLVTTPLKPGKIESKIEDCFDAATLGEIVDGKTLSLDNDPDLSVHYDKMTFAYKVVKQKMSTIDFKGFTDLFRNIELVLDDYAIKSSP
jgi:retron-type reverse transcriptase